MAGHDCIAEHQRIVNYQRKAICKACFENWPCARRMRQDLRDREGGLMTDVYYEDELVTLYCADNAMILPTLSDIGLVITSPPYNLSMGLDGVPVEAMHDRRSQSRSGNAANRLTNGYVEHEDAMSWADYTEWQHTVLNQCWDALRDDGAIFYNHKPRSQAGRYQMPFVFVPYGLTLRQVIIWNRVEKGQAYTENAYVPACEWLLLLAKSQFRLKSRSHSAASDVWDVHPERDGRGHPCPFPIGIPARAIDTTIINGPVLDPFAGIGTTLRAAKDAGVPSIGIEKSERYCEIAARRLAQEVLI